MKKIFANHKKWVVSLDMCSNEITHFILNRYL